MDNPAVSRTLPAVPMTSLHTCQMLRKLLLAVLIIPAASGPIGAAGWELQAQRDVDGANDAPVAHVHNESGYSLDIYIGLGGDVHARFMLKPRLNGLAPNHCPTFQIDDQELHNSSTDKPDCDSGRHRAGFMLGTIDGNRLVSRPVYELMHGMDITFRFKLESGGYEQTQFSLAGSKSAMRTILGHDLRIEPGQTH